MNTQQMLDAFFMIEDQDAFARSQGWEDAAQMIYYEDLARQEECQEVDESHKGFINSLKRAEQHELSKVDSREAYSDEDSACPLNAWYDTSDELAGVY